MARYSIEDTVLTNIADAIRDKNNEWEDIIIGYEDILLPVVKVSKTPNALSFTEREGAYANSLTQKETVTIEGATSLEVTLAYQSESTNYDYVTVTAGKSTSTSGTKYGGSTLTKKILTFEGTDSVSFYFKSDGSNSDYLGYYAEVIGFDADGKQIEEIQSIPIYQKQPTKEYTPTEMATAVSTFPGKPFVLTGDIHYMFSKVTTPSYTASLIPDEVQVSYNNLKQLLRLVTGTKDITNAANLFKGNIWEDEIPFDINLAESTDGTTFPSCSGMCLGMTKLERAPKINGKTGSINGLFQDCTNLRDASALEDFKFNYSNACGYLFNSCYNVRNIPSSFLKELGRGTHSTSSYKPGANPFYLCYALDEVVDFGVTTATYTSSSFSNIAYYTWRLKKFTFETNEDGTPLTANWHTQTLDFSSNCGYAYQEDTFLSRCPDFTTATRISDDATYAALKDNPDAWTKLAAYSRYNHDSAVETINSLPDTSEYLAANSEKTNTIKFKGTAGSSTDGGAINTLTEEEIAVAAAKGWTVTLV